MANTIEQVDELAEPEILTTEEILTPAEVLAETPVVETAEDLSLTPNQNVVTKTIVADPSVYDEALFHTAIFYKAVKKLKDGSQDTIAISNSRQGHVAYMLSTDAFAAWQGNASKTYEVATKSLTWAKNSSRVFSKVVADDVIFALQVKSATSNGGRKVWSGTTVAYLVSPAIYADLLP